MRKTWRTKNIIKKMHGLKVETHIKIRTKNIFNLFQNILEMMQWLD
jgi:hypothetical protein